MNKSAYIVGIIALLALGYYLYTSYNNNVSSIPSPESNADTTPSEPATDVEEVGYGYIAGSLLYPSEIIPEDLMVCAENLETTEVICTSEHQVDEQTSGKGYLLEVPVGTYYVYSQLPEQEYKAYYSEFVKCGLTIDCENHDPIEVEVTLNNTSAAYPHDWYNI